MFSSPHIQPTINNVILQGSGSGSGRPGQIDYAHCVGWVCAHEFMFTGEICIYLQVQMSSRLKWFMSCLEEKHLTDW